MTHGADQEAIAFHYDLPTPFFSLWLDDRMVYSAAMWEESFSLEEAQLAKLRWHATNVGTVGGKVLDVGCGWGGLIHMLADEFRLSAAVGLTLSAEQYQHVQRHHPGVACRLESWEAHEPDGLYDGIVSVGSLEHFASWEVSSAEKVAVYRQFFERCYEWLVSDGALSLQVIAFEDDTQASGPVARFFQESVFPSSGLPTLSELAQGFDPSFRVEAFRNDGADYEMTLRSWRRRLQDHRAEAEGIVGAEATARFSTYLGVSEALFRMRSCTLLRFRLRRRSHKRQAG